MLQLKKKKKNSLQHNENIKYALALEWNWAGLLCPPGQIFDGCLVNFQTYQSSRHGMLEFQMHNDSIFELILFIVCSPMGW